MKKGKDDFKFFDYPKEYEPVFTSERSVKACNLDKVSAFNNIPGSPDVYLRMFKKAALKYQKDLFDNLIKIVWLRSKFCYDGKHRMRNSNGWQLEHAYGTFMRRYVGLNNKNVFSSKEFTSHIVSYFEDLFPNFEEGNPFEEKYEWPFKHMNLDCILLVCKMYQRMDLLKRGERDGMDYMEFMDYVINYIKCYNEEYDDKYEFVFSQCNFNHVRHMRPGAVYGYGKAIKDQRPRTKKR